MRSRRPLQFQKTKAHFFKQWLGTSPGFAALRARVPGHLDLAIARHYEDSSLFKRTKVDRRSRYFLNKIPQKKMPFLSRALGLIPIF